MRGRERAAASISATASGSTFTSLLMSSTQVPLEASIPLLTAVGKPRFSGISRSWARGTTLRTTSQDSSPEALSTTTISVCSPVCSSAASSELRHAPRMSGRR